MQNELWLTRAARARDQWRSLRPIERACYLIGAALIGSGLVHLAVAVADPRPWLGPLSWRKPVTFGLSFGTVLIAITWVASYLQLPERTRRILLGVFAADSVLEVAGITIQAWRHVPSHFNNTTAFNAVIAYSLAAGGAVLVVVLTSLALAAFRGRTDAAPSMRLALQAGFALLPRRGLTAPSSLPAGSATPRAYRPIRSTRPPRPRLCRRRRAQRRRDPCPPHRRVLRSCSRYR